MLFTSVLFDGLSGQGLALFSLSCADQRQAIDGIRRLLKYVQRTLCIP